MAELVDSMEKLRVPDPDRECLSIRGPDVRLPSETAGLEGPPNTGRPIERRAEKRREC